MNANNFAIAILPLLTGLIGSYLTYYFTARSKQKEVVLRFREEKYANLLVLLQGFVGITATAETKRKFFDEMYRSWLYSSDDVVQAINKMVRLIIEANGASPSVENGQKAVGNIVLAMRKDLLASTNLTYADFQYIDVIADASHRKLSAR